MTQHNTPSPLPRPRTALVMAGGTGGHIFPGLAVAQELRNRGWKVVWLGAPASMESRLVPPQGFELKTIDFSGVRGKGFGTLLRLPLRLWRAWRQSRAVLREVQPQVLVGMGGYITLPAGLAGAASGLPLVLHEQNSVAGMSNRILARVARRVLTAFPGVLPPRGQWIGNPLRESFTQQESPQQRFAGRSGPLRLLVVGGSLGARALNEIVPQALALIAPDERPLVIHQSGEKEMDALRAHYERAGVQAELTPFIEDTASAFAWADVLVCRAGAGTVTELAAVGAAAVLVPFPAAVDDHQTANARFLTDAGGGWLVQQRDLDAARLADLLRAMTRDELLQRAQKAWALRKTTATCEVANACGELVA